ncbi:unnamed protein product [Taenia asiatica]|uniref:EGF-like domain-containing protein n=1 Tax=Taenia asiatica TaxID=60517 RepID=A0A0R3WBD5_TAEAS|nr:unnamed protein product [Taenia asiatica]
MRLLVGKLLIPLLCIRVVCEDPPPLAVETSSLATDVVPHYKGPLTSDATSIAAGATPTSAEVVKCASAASNGLAKTTTLSTQLPITNGRERQSSLVSGGSVPFRALQTTPLVTLNGEASSMKVVFIKENHPYLTESPPTTQPSESIGELIEETDQNVTHGPTPITTITNNKSSVDQITKETAVSSDEGITQNYSISDTLTAINSQDSTHSPGIFVTSPTISSELVDALETKPIKPVLGEVISTAHPKYTSSTDKSTKTMSSTSEGLHSPLAISGFGTNEDTTTTAETMNLNTSTVYSKATTINSFITEWIEATSPSTVKTSEGKSSSVIKPTDMLSEGYRQVTSIDSSAVSTSVEEDAQPSQSFKMFTQNVMNQSATTMDVYDIADRLSLTHSSTREGTGYAISSVDMNSPERTTSAGDSMQSTADMASDKESVKHSITTNSREEEVINVLVELGSNQSLATLQPTSSTATVLQDDSTLKAANELTTHSPSIEHEAEAMVTIPMEDSSSESTQITQDSLAISESTPPEDSTPKTAQSVVNVPDGKLSQFPDESTIAVSVTTNKIGSTFTDSGYYMNPDLPYSTPSAVKEAPEFSQSISDAYATQKTEHASNFQSLSTPPSERARGFGDEYHLSSTPPTDDIFDENRKSPSSYNPTTLATTQSEESKSVGSFPSASPSLSVTDKTDKSTSRSPQSRRDFSEDSSATAELPTSELSNLDFSRTTETPKPEKNRTIPLTTTSTKVLKEADSAVPLDPNQESKRLQKILSAGYPTPTRPVDGESTKSKKFTDPPLPPINQNRPPPKGTDPEGVTVTTAISMGLIFIFLLILFCILAVSLIAGWVHCRGRESRRPKVSLIRVERGLATEFANSWNKGRSAQAWMTTRSGTTMTSRAPGAQSPQSVSYSPPPPQSTLPPPPSFQCGCKRRNLFGSSNRLCMVHGDPSAKRNKSAVRAVKIISLTDESDDEEVGTVLLTDPGRRRASGASNAPDEDNVDCGGRSGDRRLTEWLYIDEA